MGLRKQLWLSSVVALCLWYTAAASAEIVKEERDVSGFSAVEVSGTGTILLTQGSDESLVVEADRDVLETITTRVEGDVLQIGRTSKSWFNFGRSEPIVYHLQFATLEGLTISGNVEAVAGAVSSDRMQIKVSGSGRLVLDQLETTALKATVSGSGSVEVKTLEADKFEGRISGSGSIVIGGEASTQEIRISGSGELLAANLEGDAVKARISGAGHADVWANEELDVRISGSGDLRYRGEPEISRNLSGAGHIQSAK